ncbi:MAG: ornithine carbamoyltransferase [Actinobacteria bacterium]|nr:ornithine carbamoyltransferase [Actinomycetota bacterium]
MTLSGRDFLKESDFTPGELDALLLLAADLKAAKRLGNEKQRLAGRQLAAIFEKTSTRTRVSFEVAMRDQGGHVTVLDPASSQIGHKESPADTARVLSRMFDAIEYRGAAQTVVEQLAQYADVPVYNGLTDQWHPTQMLADFLTMREHATDPLVPLRYAYLGDARSNMGNSLLVMGAMMGADVRIVAPQSLWPAADVQEIARAHALATGARIMLTDDVPQGVDGAEFVHTDVWVSMGEPAEVWAQRVDLLRPYRVDAAVMAATGDPMAKFMHCLPAYHDQQTSIGRRLAEDFGLTDGVEVSHGVFESPASVVFDQAENRMHTIKAILVATLT